MKASIHFEVQVPIKIFREDDLFISHCPVFDVSSQGTTQDEAKQNIIEALTGFLITCYEMGTLSEVLKECGFKPGKLQDSSGLCEDDMSFIDIPLPFMLNDNKLSSECLA
jgi:predicted RNase H-like HicB family nuclease